MSYVMRSRNAERWLKEALRQLAMANQPWAGREPGRVARGQRLYNALEKAEAAVEELRQADPNYTRPFPWRAVEGRSQHGTTDPS